MEYFKIGLPFQIKIDLKYINGNPAPIVPVRVVAMGKLLDGTLRSLHGDEDAGQITDNTNSDGQVNFNIYVPPGCTEITVTLTTQVDELRVEGHENLDI
ncbi:hypothetical protein, partial [Salmonella sp. s55962]|uniref:hypothetical protein n=1 Tax=Salmonella sp. s55962 TaxID=3159685 RepID=UPI0039809C10